MLSRHLGVLVIHTLGLLTNISYNPDLNLVSFLAILHFLKVIYALILLLTESTLPVMFCLMSLSSPLLIILASLILIFLSPHLSLIGYLNPHKLLMNLFLLHLLNLLLSLHFLTSHLLFFLLFLSPSIPIPVVPPPLAIPSSFPTPLSLPTFVPSSSNSQIVPRVSNSPAIVPISLILILCS